jgi:hypothetical protein
MTVRRNHPAQPRMLVALAVVLCALLAGPPTAPTPGPAASSRSEPLVLAGTIYRDLGMVSRLPGSAGGDHLVRVDQLAVGDKPAPPSVPWATRPPRAEQAAGQDVADAPRARAPPARD